MWSDAVLRAEQLQTLRLLLWAGASVICGTALLAITLFQRRGSALIRRFASVCAALGALELTYAAYRYVRLAPRDLSSVARLERVTWLEAGLFFGVAGIGITLVLSARHLAASDSAATDRALPAVGAGVAVMLHGLALALLQLLLLAVIST